VEDTACALAWDPPDVRIEEKSSRVYTTLLEGTDRHMDKQRYSWVFLAASAAFFLFIVGLTGYRIETARRGNSAAAVERLGAVAEKAAGLRRAAGSFDSPLFRREMRKLFDGEARLLLLALRSPSRGALYLVTRNRSYVGRQEPPSSQPPALPSYSYTRGYEKLVTVPFPGGLDAGEALDAEVDGLFIIMGREDLYPILRDDLYLFLVFLLVCGVFILIVTGIQHDEAGSGAGAPGAGTAGPSPIPGSTQLTQRLQAEIDRAAAAEQDIALGMLRLDRGAGSGAAGASSEAVGRILQESYSRDLLFATDDGGVAVVLPDTDIDQAVRSLETVRKRAAETAVPAGPCRVSIGASSRAGRLVEERTLLDEAATALEKASREGGNRVVGFRADPAKFRRALSG
jgi:hypothetical protein